MVFMFFAAGIAAIFFICALIVLHCGVLWACVIDSAKRSKASPDLLPLREQSSG